MVNVMRETVWSHDVIQIMMSQSSSMSINRWSKCYSIIHIWAVTHHHHHLFIDAQGINHLSHATLLALRDASEINMIRFVIKSLFIKLLWALLLPSPNQTYIHIYYLHTCRYTYIHTKTTNRNQYIHCYNMLMKLIYSIAYSHPVLNMCYSTPLMKEYIHLCYYVLMILIQ